MNKYTQQTHSNPRAIVLGALNRRPPVVSYQLSASTVTKHLDDVVQEIDRLMSTVFYSPEQPYYKRNHVELMKAYRMLLYAIAQHWGDCIGVIKSFFPLDQGKHRNHYIKHFREVADTYHSHFIGVANHLKHNQANLRYCAFIGRFDADSFIRSWTDILPGYFIEEVIGDGRVGPSPDFHKDGKGARSFFRDLRCAVAAIIEWSNALIKVIGCIDLPDIYVPV